MPVTLLEMDSLALVVAAGIWTAPCKGLPENGNVEAGFVEAGLVEPVFPGALARLQIGNS